MIPTGRNRGNVLTKKRDIPSPVNGGIVSFPVKKGDAVLKM